MSQPTPYFQHTDYSDELTTSQVPGTHGEHLDQEFQALLLTISQVLQNLSLLQRDDAALANEIVTPDTLAPETLILMGSAAWTVSGAWVTATAYEVGDLVSEGGSTYVCAIAHTSGTFSTDLSAAKWLGITSATTASAISFGPSGTIAANTVQTAIAEVATEALQKSSNLGDLQSAPSALTALGLSTYFKTLVSALSSGALRTLLELGTMAVQNSDAIGATAAGAGTVTITFTNATGLRGSVNITDDGITVLGPKYVQVGASYGQVGALASAGGAIAINTTMNNNFSHTMTENTTLGAPVGATPGQSGFITFTQHASAAKTLAFNSFWKTANGVPMPAISTVVGSKNIFKYIVCEAGFAECSLSPNVS